MTTNATAPVGARDVIAASVVECHRFPGAMEDEYEWADAILAALRAAGKVIVEADDADQAILALDHMSDRNTNYDDPWAGPCERISAVMREHYAVLTDGGSQ